MSTETKPTSAINTSERLFDLVRYMRSELHRAQLITDAEYSWLCHDSPMATSQKGGSPSRERLEDYDDIRAKLKIATDALESLTQYKPHLCDVPEYSEGVDMGRACAADTAREALQAIQSPRP